MSKYKEQIKQLRTQGYSYRQIAKILHCSKSIIGYHLDDSQKAKMLKRQYQRRKSTHPYQVKIENFKHRKCKKESNIDFTLQDIVNKFGENPVCYLTGQHIDIYKTNSYQFDHILPISRGGNNNIDNLAICTTQVNQAKGNMTNTEFILLCQQVTQNFSQ